MKNQQYHYLCLIEELRKRLQNGQLHAGDVLPSEQEWAEALSIKKRDVRPILKNLEMTGVLSCSKEGEMTLSKDILIPQNSKRFSDSEESTNPAVRVTERKL